MSTREHGVEMGFTGERFPENTHLCLIFDDEEQRREIVSKYVSTGLRLRERVRYFADSRSPVDAHSWLRSAGVEVPEVPTDDRCKFLQADLAYCPGGRFDPEKMIEALKVGYEEGKKAGFTGSRACSEMSWALRGIPGSEHLLEYEAMLNVIETDFPHTGMCQYDARRFDGATLFRVLQLHPFMVAQGQIVRNPFYERPEKTPASATRG